MSRPGAEQGVVDLSVLRPLGQDDALSSCGSSDPFNDLFPVDGLGDESLSTGAERLVHSLRVIGEAEDDHRPVAGVRAQRSHSLAEGVEFPVGVEQRDVDRPPRSFPDVHFDDHDLRLTGRQDGTQSFEDDHVVVDERDPDRRGHRVTLNGGQRVSRITRSGD